MPKNDQTEKRILEVDGNPLEGLVSISEYTVEETTVRVPGYAKDVPVRSGVEVLPEIDAVFKVTRNSESYQILEDWYKKRETHNVTHRRMDGSGQEFKRELWPNTEVSRFNPGGYDASSPDFAKILVRFLPESIDPIAAQ